MNITITVKDLENFNGPVNLEGFAEACFNMNTIKDLEKPASATDLEEWEITREKSNEDQKEAMMNLYFYIAEEWLDEHTGWEPKVNEAGVSIYSGDDFNDTSQYAERNNCDSDILERIICKTWDFYNV